MEPKRKLMAITSCEGEGGSRKSGGMIDRLGKLPVEVAHHILSFLTITDLALLSCVSRKCREFSLSTPSLDFDDFSVESTSTCNKQLRLWNSLDRFLFRRGDNKIQYLRVRWSSHFVDDNDETPCYCCDDEYFRTMSWVHNAVRCNVEDLDLKISAFSEIAPKFPPSVFLSGSLTSLSVNMSCMVLQAPSVALLSNLKFLRVKQVIVDEGFFKWISTCCKCIEDIVIRDVFGDNITIESSSLKRFSFVGTDAVDTLNISGEKLEDILIDWTFDSPGRKSLNIVARNLKKFKWAGSLMVHGSLGKLDCLEEATVLLLPKADDFHNIFDVLSSLRMVEVLELNHGSIKALFREGSIPAPLDNVCRLHMYVGSFDDDLIPSIVSLFRAMPNLCTLYIKSRPPLHGPKSNTSEFNMGYWKLQDLAFLHQLKNVTIEICNEESNGIELARYLEDHAQNLEEMRTMHLRQK
ncbi:hypothetical protein M0R45_029814 [Rubus argutus]|uniref:F-box domain-containing protein n=1 Tax=Rubus argutus TaxID=59490 RepID=A0AAW1W9Y8_RUBAR